MGAHYIKLYHSVEEWRSKLSIPHRTNNARKLQTERKLQNAQNPRYRKPRT